MPHKTVQPGRVFHLQPTALWLKIRMFREGAYRTPFRRCRPATIAGQDAHHGAGVVGDRHTYKPGLRGTQPASNQESQNDLSEANCLGISRRITGPTSANRSF
jgi:hypothetical protein